MRPQTRIVLLTLAVLSLYSCRKDSATSVMQSGADISMETTPGTPGKGITPARETSVPVASSYYFEYPDIDLEMVQGFICLNDSLAEGRQLSIFNKDGSPWKTLNFTDSGLAEISRSEDFYPFLWNEDQFRFIFSSTAEQGEYYEVIVNGDLRERKYIRRNDSLVTYQHWENFLLSEVGNISFDSLNNPPRISPDDKADRVPSVDYDFGYFFVEEIKGEWVKISWGETQNTGWVRWRKKNKLLLQLAFSC